MTRVVGIVDSNHYSPIRDLLKLHITILYPYCIAVCPCCQASWYSALFVRDVSLDTHVLVNC